ncbi:MAG TPA: hypothetical protein VG674_20480 [Amycolatopsis sp.]|nr:hypothetical protein [Amycolatopsis sp.]
MAPSTGPRVSVLCEQAGDALAERAARYGVTDVLTRVVEAASRGEVAESDLDALDAAFAAHGIDHLTQGHRGFEPWPGARDVGYLVWECPTGACSRATTGDRPACRLTGRPFRETRVDL